MALEFVITTYCGDARGLVSRNLLHSGCSALQISTLQDHNGFSIHVVHVIFVVDHFTILP